MPVSWLRTGSIGHASLFFYMSNPINQQSHLRIYSDMDIDSVVDWTAAVFIFRNVNVSYEPRQFVLLNSRGNVNQRLVQNNR